MRVRIFFNKLTIKRVICLIFALVMVSESIVGTTKVFAIPDESFYSSNDILFYDPDTSCGTDTDATGVPSLVGNSNAEKIWNFLRNDKGLTNEQTAGVMGNLRAESGENFDPGAEEISGGGGFGIAQWTGGRRTALQEAAKKANDGKGVPVNDLAFQLEYLYQELNARGTNRPEYKQFKNEWEMLKGQTAINDALVAFHHEFEISHLMNKPDPRAAVIEARGQFAADAYASFANSTPGGGAQNASLCEFAPTGNLEQTILAYAWPDYKGRGYTTKKAEYEAAVKKAKSDGRYTGDTCYGGGVDCGAFVTILMIDSGFEPSYNHSGKINQGAGATPTQHKWLQQNWERVGTGNEVSVGGDPSNEKVLRQGDVAIKSGHTYMYAGDIPGFNSKIASASQCDRAPMAGKESPTDGDFTWYRKKNTNTGGAEEDAIDQRL